MAEQLQIPISRRVASATITAVVAASVSVLYTTISGAINAPRDIAILRSSVAELKEQYAQDSVGRLNARVERAELRSDLRALTKQVDRLADTLVREREFWEKRMRNGSLIE